MNEDDRKTQEIDARLVNEVADCNARGGAALAVIEIPKGTFQPPTRIEANSAFQSLSKNEKVKIIASATTELDLMVLELTRPELFENLDQGIGPDSGSANQTARTS